MFTESRNGPGRRNFDCTNMANTSLVASDVKTVNKAPSCSSSAEKSVKTAQQQSTPSSCKNGVNGLLHIRESYEARGISESTCNLLMASWRPGTQKQYQVYIQKWSHFCTRRKINHNQPTVEQALDFFTHLYEQGLTYSAINTARSALSSYITLEDGTSLGQHPLVSRLLRGILSRHHCPRDPMRLPSACATSVPFRARYQFSRGFTLRGEKRLYLEVSWRFFVFKSF